MSAGSFSRAWQAHESSGLPNRVQVNWRPAKHLVSTCRDTLYVLTRAAWLIWRFGMDFHPMGPQIQPSLRPPVRHDYSISNAGQSRERDGEPAGDLSE